MPEFERSSHLDCKEPNLTGGERARKRETFWEDFSIYMNCHGKRDLKLLMKFTDSPETTGCCVQPSDWCIQLPAEGRMQLSSGLAQAGEGPHTGSACVVR